MSLVSIQDRKVVIDGFAENANKTSFFENSLLQLRRAKENESNFKWKGRKIEKVMAKNILIYDSVDIRCFFWLIIKGIKIDMPDSFISPNIETELIEAIELLKNRKIKVKEGSSIRVPLLQDRK